MGDKDGEKGRAWGHGSVDPTPYSDFKLPFMMADPDSVTVSGHSAGCYMSDQMMIVNSASIKGAGLY